MLEGCSVLNASEVIFSSELSILRGLEVFLRCPLNFDADNMFDCVSRGAGYVRGTYSLAGGNHP